LGQLSIHYSPKTSSILNAFCCSSGERAFLRLDLRLSLSQKFSAIDYPVALQVIQHYPVDPHFRLEPV